MKKLLLAIVVIVVSFSAKAQIMTTFVDTFIDAEYTINPNGLAVDGVGNLYVGDEQNSVYKVTPDGVVAKIAGAPGYGFSGDGGPAIDAVLYQPRGVCVDVTGNIFIADMANNCIRKIDTAGIISTVAGTPGVMGFAGDGGSATSALLNQPFAVTVDNVGNIYIADTHNDRVRKVNTVGIISTLGGGGSADTDGVLATSVDIDGPISIAWSPIGGLCVSEYYKNRIRKISTSGIISTVAGTNVGGSIGFTDGAYNGDNIPANAAQLAGPVGITFDLDGNLYIVDGSNARIRKVGTDGLISTIAGTGVEGNTGDGGPACYAQLSYPWGIAVNDSGKIFVASFNKIKEINTTIVVPYFTNGHSQILNACFDSLHIDSLLAYTDLDTGHTLIWTLINKPLHGNIDSTYTAMSTGGIVTPSGLTYIRDSGYNGSDSFVYLMTNGSVFDTATFAIHCDGITKVNTLAGAPNGINIYPNPSGGDFSINISTETQQNTDITITNLIGSVIKTFTGKTNNVLNIKVNAPPGIYFITATTTDNRFNGSIVIEN